MKKGMEKETGKEARAPLSLDEFRRAQNNFWMHFSLSGDIGGFYREKPYYKRFSQEYPEMEAQLKTEIEEVDDYLKGKKKPPKDSVYYDFFGLGWNGISEADTILPIYESLYKAYEIMRTYVEDDEILFR